MKSVSPLELKKWIDSGKKIQLIDVREKHEFDIVHLSPAVHIPLRQLDGNDMLIDRNVPAVIYCHHGSRSLMACMILLQKGFTALINLDGGIHAYAVEADPSLKTY